VLTLHIGKGQHLVLVESSDRSTRISEIEHPAHVGGVEPRQAEDEDGAYRATVERQSKSSRDAISRDARARLSNKPALIAQCIGRTVPIEINHWNVNSSALQCGLQFIGS
jgi:hypothetical protein